MFQILQGKFRMLQWGEGTSGIKTQKREKCGSFRRGAPTKKPNTRFGFLKKVM
jgi:hypothetical protein